MRFSLSRHLQEALRGVAVANAPARRARTRAGSSPPEGLEGRQLLSLTNVAIAEGNVNVANFHARLPSAPGSGLAAQYQTFDESAASTTKMKKDPISGITFTEPAEYTATSGAFAYAPNARDHVVSVPVTPDKDFEYHESFALQVNTPGRSRYGIARVINHHGRVPHAILSNPTIIETGSAGLQAQFNVSLSFAPRSQMTFIYTTRDESAKAGVDYTTQASPGYPSPTTTTPTSTTPTSTTPTSTTPTSTTPTSTTPTTTAPGTTTTPSITTVPGYSLATAPVPANPSYLVFAAGQTTPETIRVPVATEPGFHKPKRFALEVEGPGRLAYGIATIKWIHPRNPIPIVSNPVVVETGTS